jgi:hypothetical protein
LATVLADRYSCCAICVFGRAGRDAVEDGPFALGELRERGAAGRRWRGKERAEPRGQRGAEDGLAGVCRPDRGQDGGAVRALDEIADRAGGDRGEDHVVVLEHGEHQHRRLRMLADDLPGGVDAVEFRHLQVHQHHVGPQLG